jgi:hypothetical protein
MFRLVAFVALSIAVLFAAVGTTRAGQYATPEEAKALLEKAVVAVKQDKAKALICSTREKAGLRTVTFMCSAPTQETAL